MKGKKSYKILRTLVYSIFVFLLIFPVFIMINTSLKNYSDITIWPPTWFKNPQWINYKEVIFGEKNIIKPLKNSLIVSASSALISLFIGILAAYSSSRFKFRARKSFLAIIIITQMFSPVILVNPMYIIFRDLNLLDTRISLIIANTATCLPMTIWLLLSYINKIPKSLEESAWIDGCSRINGIRYIVLPLLIPGAISTGLFSFLMAWGDLIFAKSFILSPEMRTISLALTDFQSLYKTSWEMQMTASVISVIPTLIIFFIIQKHLVKGLSSAGIKG